MVRRKTEEVTKLPKWWGAKDGLPIKVTHVGRWTLSGGGSRTVDAIQKSGK